MQPLQPLQCGGAERTGLASWAPSHRINNDHGMLRTRGFLGHCERCLANNVSLAPRDICVQVQVQASGAWDYRSVGVVGEKDCLRSTMYLLLARVEHREGVS